MKKQSISMLLAALMVSNSVPMAAMAQSRVDDALIDQSIAAQSNEMKRTLQQIDALISSMEKYKTASQSEKQNAFVNAARLMITLLGLGSTMVHTCIQRSIKAITDAGNKRRRLRYNSRDAW